MNLRSALRPFLPPFVKRIYHERLLANLSPEADAIRCRELVKPGDCVIDVGANIGAYTKFLSDWVGPNGSVHSFEPIPETFSYLRNNVRKFGMGNVFAHNAAVSSQSGTVAMHVPNGNFYRAMITPSGDHTVQLVRLDDQSYAWRVAFIKCDAERHEAEVIEGALGIIARDHPIWLIETWDAKVVERMVNLGYQATKLEQNWLFQ
jgi:FkbM family methyltransferase